MRPMSDRPDDATVRLEVGADPEVAFLSAQRLRVLEGPDAGATFAARRTPLVLGSGDGCDVVLHDRTVSRFHCEITVDAGHLVVRDLGSANGTTVDGVRVLAAHLRSGATLVLGTTKLVFDGVGEPVRVPLARASRFGSLVGLSTVMRATFALLERAASSDAAILLSGETGTGKEGAAESIHAASRRAEHPFIIVDCGAIPPQLLESELFGHEKGAFTGATASRAGAFEAAHRGTLFLDEIGELPIDLQPKLLRALERKHVKRVGSTAYADVDVRIVAATNRDLRAEVNDGRFRSDLYYRLAVVEVRMPPLRERTEDLGLLVDAVLEGLGAARAPQADALRSKEFLAELGRHPWPGNVRELRNHLERCLALRELSMPTATTTTPTRALEVTADRPLREARDAWEREFERRYLEALLARHGENVSAAARAAGVDRKYLYRLLWRAGLR